MAWSREDSRKLRALCRSGANLEQAATVLGRERSAVGDRARRMGLRWAGSRDRSPWSAADDQALEQLIAGGATLAGAAHQMSRSLKTVSARALELSLAGSGYQPRRRWTDADTEQLRALIAGGATRTEAARALGREVTVIRQRAGWHGIDWPESAGPRPLNAGGSERKVDLEAAGERWLAYLQDIRRVRPLTLKSCRSLLRVSFALFPDDYDPVAVPRLLEARLGPRASASMRYSTFDTLHRFFDWWHEEGGPANPLARTRRPPKSQARRRPLTRAELVILQVRLRDASTRDRALVSLLLYEAFRIGDVAGLRLADVDLAGGWVRVVDGKGGLDVQLPLVAPARAALAAWLTESGEDRLYVFPGQLGRISTQAVANIWGRVAGEELGACAHQLRNTCATLLTELGVDLVDVQAIMRHKSVATTMRYIAQDPERQRVGLERLAQHVSGPALSGPAPREHAMPPLVPVAAAGEQIQQGLAVFLEGRGAAIYVSCELNPSELAGELQGLLQRTDGEDWPQGGFAQMLVEEALAPGTEPYRLSACPPAFRGNVVVVDEANMTIGVIPAGAAAALRTWSFAEFVDLDWTSKPLVGNLFDPGFQLRHYGVDPIWTN